MLGLTHVVEQTAVLVDAGAVHVFGELTLPDAATGIVVLVHGLGTGWDAARNRALAESLARAGVGTLVCDLFTEGEVSVDRLTRHLRHDSRALAERATTVVAWLRRQKRFRHTPVGLFGTGAGAAAALIASVARPEVAAVVAHGGPTQPPRDTLAGVRCPTLFVAGAADGEAIAASCRATRQMTAPSSVHIVPRCRQLDEPAGVHDLAEAAAGWFSAHLDGDGPGLVRASTVAAR